MFIDACPPALLPPIVVVTPLLLASFFMTVRNLIASSPGRPSSHLLLHIIHDLIVYSVQFLRRSISSSLGHHSCPVPDQLSVILLRSDVVDPPHILSLTIFAISSHIVSTFQHLRLRCHSACMLRVWRNMCICTFTVPTLRLVVLISSSPTVRHLIAFSSGANPPTYSRSTRV